MVQAQEQETREIIRQRLKFRFIETSQEMENYAVTMEKEDGNIQIRNSWDYDSNNQVTFGECKLLRGYKPADFKSYIQNYETLASTTNNSIESSELITTDNGVDTIKLVMKVPWPCWSRVFYVTRYMELDMEDGS